MASREKFFFLPEMLDHKDIENLKLKEALDKIWELVVEANQSIDKNEPWNLAKKELSREFFVNHV